MSKAAGGPAAPGPHDASGLWRDAIDHHAPRPMDPPTGRLVVVAAHPDDETLAAGGYLRAAHAAGCVVEIVIATDGEAAFPDAAAADRAALGRARRRELYEALGSLGAADVPVHRLGLPDSGLEEAESTLAEELEPLLQHADAYLAPWSGDPHPDHAAAGRAAAVAAPVTAHGWAYPIWALARERPDQDRIPWSRAYLHVMSEADRAAKRAAIGRFTSQLEPAPDGGPPILPAEVLRLFDTERELFFREPRAASAPADRFATLYSGGDGDPWQTRTSWYEIRKRAVLLACLPHARYAHAAEPGCGTGAHRGQAGGRARRGRGRPPRALARPAGGGPAGRGGHPPTAARGPPLRRPARAHGRGVPRPRAAPPVTRIDAVGVVVPAHDEQDRIGACVAAVVEALAALPDRVATTVCVVLDRCSDRTEDRAREAARLPLVDLVPNRVRVTVGEVRNHGVARLLARLGGVPLNGRGRRRRARARLRGEPRRAGGVLPAGRGLPGGRARRGARTAGTAARARAPGRLPVRRPGPHLRAPPGPGAGRAGRSAGQPARAARVSASEAREKCRYRPTVIRRVKPSGSRWCVTESHNWWLIQSPSPAVALPAAGSRPA
jgi:LmbE family N-acetylglucosaminyl deacetylase